MNRAYKRIVYFLVSFCMLLSMNTSVAFAEHLEIEKNKADYIMSLEGPTVIFELEENENGDFEGRANVGATAISCVLSGNTGGIDRLYEIYIRWTGTNFVEAIRANAMWILDRDILNPTTFYYKSFYVDGLSAPSGFSPIGTCYIPDGIDAVRIRTVGLQAYFYDKDFWLSNGEINDSYYL